VLNLRLRHTDQPLLNQAVAGVDIRTVGQVWAFSARASSVDVTPLLAVTLAAGAAREVEPVAAAPAFVDLSDYLDDD
jgi:hypothetical protein